MTFSNIESILSIIPKDKFHSCVVTGFSFDFHYFEHVALSLIKRSGATNISLLIDSSMLSESLGKISGDTKFLSKTYSVSGIKRSGAFHPKIILLYGKDEGFLIIGSGNPTAAGHGNNHELWNAFHITGNADLKFPIFYHASEYVFKFSEEIAGIARQRFDWIKDSTPWLTTSEVSVKNTIHLPDQTEATLLLTSNSTIFEQVHSSVKDDIHEILVISPFFDTNGDLIEQFLEKHKNASIKILFQPGRSHIPHKISNDKRVQFYNWDSVLGDESETARYLHAKLVHIKTNASNYLITGSANFTSAAFKSDDTKKINEEACLLLSTKTRDFLDEIGINMNNLEPLDKSSLQNYRIDVDTNNKPEGTEEIQIIGADRKSDQLLLYIKGIPRSPNFIVDCLNEWGEVRASFPVGLNGNLVQIIISTSLDIIFVEARSDTTKISNKQIVNDFYYAIKSSPNSKQRKYESIMEDLAKGNADLFELIQHLDMSELLEGNPSVTPSVKSQGLSNDTINDLDSEEGKILTPEDYLKLGETQIGHQNLLEAYEKSGIAYVFSQYQEIFSKRSETVSAISQDEEEGDDPDASTGRDEKSENLTTESKLKGIRKTVSRFFDKYLGILQSQIDSHASPTLIDFSMYILALRLLRHTYEETIELKDGSQHKVLEWKTYLNYGSISTYAIEIISKFSQFSSRILLPSDNKTLERYYDFKHVAYVESVFTLTLQPNVMKWEDGSQEIKWQDWLWCTYMNIHLNLSNSGFPIQEVENLGATFRNKNLTLEVGFKQIHENILLLQNWSKDFSQREKWTRYFESEVNLRVFSEADGFCVIRRNIPAVKSRKVALSHCGYDFDDAESDYMKPKEVLLSIAKIFKI